MDNYDLLRNVGFSALAVKCYEALDEMSGLSVTQLSQALSRPRSGLYRVLKQLEKQGFVDSIKTPGHPTYYYGIALYDAWPSFINYQKIFIKPLVDKQEARRNKMRRASGIF